MWRPIAFTSVTRHWYEVEEDDDAEDVRPPSHKHRVNIYKKTLSSSLPQKEKGYVHKPPGRKPNILYFY